MIDEYNSDLITLSLSPEIIPQTYRLSELFEKSKFKVNSNKEWVKTLREIADKMDDKF